MFPYSWFGSSLDPMASRTVKLAIFRARDSPGTALISDQACLQMFQHNSARCSVFDYWSSVTDGYLHFEGSALMPWVEIKMPPGDISRGTQLTLAYAATDALSDSDDLSAYDGYVVIVMPGNGLDGGSGTLSNGKGFCTLPVMASDHTFMCHETGHVLGFVHSYGVLNNGIDWDGRAPFDEGQIYGDPYDLMSSASFGTRGHDPAVKHWFSNPTFVGPAVAGWPNPAATSMGPAPARAHVHMWDAGALSVASVRHASAPVGGTTLTARIYAAGARGQQTELLVVHPPSEDAQGRGRFYVEYRKAGGWDAGLDVFGTDLARQAVVVHELADAIDIFDKGVRCWYRGHVLVGVETDSDIAIAGTPWVVQVTGVGPDDAYAEVHVSSTVERGVEVRVVETHDVIASNDEKTLTTPCGDQVISATWITESTYVFTPTSFGYGGTGAPFAPPVPITWSMGGAAVAVGSGSIAVPTAEGIFNVTYQLDPISAELIIQSRGGERYSTDVVATASESDGTQPTTARQAFDPPGWWTGFSAADLRKIDECLARKLIPLKVRIRDLLVPSNAEHRPGHLRDRINARRLELLAQLVAETHPAAAQAIEELSQLRLTAHP